MEPQPGPPEDDAPPIVGRSDTGGPWSVAWPLAALAVIGVLTLRACITSVPPSAPEVPRAPVSGAAGSR